MSRPLRIQYPNALYHITSRGNARSKIYLDSKDYENFLVVFSDVIKRYNWICYAYCLMPNHYHVLIETPDANLAAGMRQLNGVYTQKFNYNHKRVGHIFQGRYKAILVEKEDYLGELMRYIALNPVRAKIVDRPSQWKYSSHKELIGKMESTGCVDVKNALKIFDQSAEKARKIYIDFLNEKNPEGVWEELRGGVLLGSIEFVEKIKKYLTKKGKELEIPRKERLAHRPSLKSLLNTEIKTKKERNKIIREAYFDHGYSLSEIGREISMHYTSISVIIKKQEKHKRSKTL